MADSPAERKRKQRIREAQHQLECGATEKTMTFYNGTLADLEYLKNVGGFTQNEEVITYLIHNAVNILKRDMSQLDNWLDVPGKQVIDALKDSNYYIDARKYLGAISGMESLGYHYYQGDWVLTDVNN